MTGVDTSREAVERLAAKFDGNAADGRWDDDHHAAAATLRALREERDAEYVLSRQLKCEVDAGIARADAALADQARLREAVTRLIGEHDSYMDAIQDQVTAGNMRADPLGEAVEDTRAALAGEAGR